MFNQFFTRQMPGRKGQVWTLILKFSPSLMSPLPFLGHMVTEMGPQQKESSR